MQHDNRKDSYKPVMVVIICFQSILCADQIHLRNGDILEGTVKQRDSERVLLEHADLGEIWIPRRRIVKIVQDPADDPNVPPPGYLGRLKQQGWKNTIDLSLDNSFGNTDEQSNRFAYKATRKRDDSDLNIDTSYYHKEKSGRISDNKWTLGGTYRWLKPAKAAYWFGTGRFDYDEFKSWNKRGSLHFGPGYQLYDSNSVTLTADVGMGSRRESGSRNDQWKFEGLTGFTFQWQVTEGQAFDAGATFTPVLDDFDDFRARASLNWRLLVSREANLSLILGLLNEYQSIVDPGIDRNDLRMFAGLQVAF